MKKKLFITTIAIIVIAHLQAQTEPAAGNWKTWFIASGKDYRLPAPASYKDEIAQVISKQENLDSAGWQQIIYWSAGAPGYHWQEMMNKLWMYDTSYDGAWANLILNTAIYDATVAAWNSKYAYKRPRPFAADSRIKASILKPESPSYPCEYSVAAGVAVVVISKFYPYLADSVNHMAQRLMTSRITAGVAFPSDTRDGFELGKKIAQNEIEHTKDFTNKIPWDGKMPQQPGVWKGQQPMFPLAGLNKTVVLTSASQFRPGPPPDFTKDMTELKNYKQTFRSQANAFYWASQDFWSEALTKKIFENNYHLNPPRAARLYAISAVAAYDAFIACFDAKYAYWGIRPDQYDTTYHSLVPTPPFPGYPSGHAVMSGMYSELYSYFFPADASYFRKKAKDAAESRFQAGIHFRTDNEVGLDLGRKVASVVIQKVMSDSADDALPFAGRRKTDLNAQTKKH
jgi:hypothetical protein